MNNTKGPLFGLSKQSSESEESYRLRVISETHAKASVPVKAVVPPLKPAVNDKKHK